MLGKVGLMVFQAFSLPYHSNDVSFMVADGSRNILQAAAQMGIDQACSKMHDML